MKILVPSAPLASTPTTTLVNSPSPSSHRRSNNRGRRHHGRSQWSWRDLSTSALATLSPAPARISRPTFTTPYTHTTIHYSNPDDSSELVVDSGASHYVTMDHATLALHEPYTTSNLVFLSVLFSCTPSHIFFETRCVASIRVFFFFF